MKDGECLKLGQAGTTGIKATEIPATNTFGRRRKAGP